MLSDGGAHLKSCREGGKSINCFLRISRSKGNIISGRGSDFMQHLYGVSVRGKMIYFAGSIPDDKFEEVEEIANQIDCALMEDTFCKQFVDTIRFQLGIELNHQPIEYIFRVRKK